MNPTIPFSGPPKNRTELLYRINELRARKVVLETEMDQSVKDLAHGLNPINLLSNAAKSLMHDDSTSTFMLRTGVSEVLGFALRNVLFPSFGKKLIGGIALRGAQKLVTDKILNNRDLIGNASTMLWNEIKTRFSKNGHHHNGHGESHNQ